MLPHVGGGGVMQQRRKKTGGNSAWKNSLGQTNGEIVDVICLTEEDLKAVETDG